MPRTRQDFIARVLNELGAVGAGQTPDAEDVADIDARIESAFAELSGRRVYYVQNAEAIADEAFEPLVAYVANMASPAYGQPKIDAVKMDAESRLRQLLRSGVYHPVRHEYF